MGMPSNPPWMPPSMNGVLNPTCTVLVLSVLAVHFLGQSACILFSGTFSGHPGDGDTESVGFYEDRIMVKAVAQFCEAFH